MSLLRTTELSHVFTTGITAIDRVTLWFEEGEFVVIAGKNGSGKTVLMLHLNGLLKPTSGEVLYRDIPIRKRIRTVRQKIGLVFQEPDYQLVGQTVAEDIALGPENLGLPRNEVDSRVEHALTVLGIEQLRERQPFSLSGGEKRKAALAGILTMRPEIIILDEPFSGLDLPGVRSVLESLILLHSAGHTIVVITHDIDKVLAHANRLVVMDQGRVVEDAAPSEIISRVEQYGIRGMAKNMSVSDLTWLR
jgi:biotin transport system ATP-binding protein